MQGCEWDMKNRQLFSVADSAGYTCHLVFSRNFASNAIAEESAAVNKGRITENLFIA